MPTPINLLPGEFAPKGRAATVANLARNGVILGFSVFIILTSGMVSLFILNSFSLRDSAARQETLKTVIKSLEATEQRFILVKDRVGVAREIFAKDSASEGLNKLSNLLTSTSAGATFAEAEVSVQKTKFSILASNSSDLAKFMANLVSVNLYKKIDLVSFGFSPTTGYLASFETSVK